MQNNYGPPQSGPGGPKFNLSNMDGLEGPSVLNNFHDSSLPASFPPPPPPFPHTSNVQIIAK